mmetsp:Transcript_15066/g.24800  ORF Transcript_15066/g.24800 Transcript_15066/m.24800 type:complete len:522 (+) Transcript_15066:154-1719(+)
MGEPKESKESKEPKESSITKLRTFVLKPRLYQDWGEEQDPRKVSWGDLFLDLFLVAASVNITHIIIEDPTAQGFGKFFLYVCLFISNWSGHTMFKTRFRLEGFFFDFLTFFFLLGVTGMIVNTGMYDAYVGFSVSLIISLVSILLSYVIVGINIERARPFSIVMGTSILLKIAVCIVACVYGNSTGAFVGCMVAVLVLDPLGILPMLKLKNVRLPLHVEHTGERYGLLMMIFLGESILNLGKTIKPYSAWQHYMAIAFGVAIIYNLYLAYYHVDPDQHDHALRKNRYRGLIWNYAHVLLAVCFLMIGAGLGLHLSTYTSAGHEASAGTHAITHAVIHAAEEDPPLEDGEFIDIPYSDTYPASYAWILCIGYSFGLHVTWVIRATHFLFIGQKNPLHGTGLEFLQNLWWVSVFVWACVTYFLPLIKDQVGVLGVLGLLMAHSVILNLVETSITHRIFLSPHFKETSIHVVRLNSLFKREQTSSSSMSMSNGSVPTAKDSRGTEESFEMTDEGRTKKEEGETD